MTQFLDPTKKTKENLLNKVRNERAERKLAKKKEEVSYIIQRWWRTSYQRKQFQQDLRISSDKDNRIIATHCKQKQTESKCNDEPSQIITTCYNMIRKLNLFYDINIQQDRNRLTIIIANTLKLFNMNNSKYNNYIAFGFALNDINKKQNFYSLIYKLWLNINNTFNFHYNKYKNKNTNIKEKKTITTHIKILINFLISFMDISKWKIIQNECDKYKTMIKLIKKNHSSFIKKYICNKAKIFYSDWKKIIIFLEDLGLKLISSNALKITVIPTKLSPNLLKEFSQQILSIPYLSTQYKDLFIVKNNKNNKCELSWIWKKCLSLYANINNIKNIRITGESKGIPNSAWFVSNCSTLILAETMHNIQFEQFVIFFNQLITQYSKHLSFNDDAVEEKDLNIYQSGFQNLYDSNIILKLFWNILNCEPIKTYCIKVTEPINNNIAKLLIEKQNKNIIK
eukprot:99556_1